MLSLLQTPNGFRTATDFIKLKPGTTGEIEEKTLSSASPGALNFTTKSFTQHDVFLFKYSVFSFPRTAFLSYSHDNSQLKAKE